MKEFYLSYRIGKNANVKEMPDLNDAADLDDCIIDLWKEGIDAVWIGDKTVVSKSYV